MWLVMMVVGQWEQTLKSGYHLGLVVHLLQLLRKLRQEGFKFKDIMCCRASARAPEQPGQTLFQDTK